MPNSNTLKFNPRARIIRTVGDHLISGPEAAVIELVKNAHDADASYVRVKFVPPLEEGAGSIIVDDDGHGMTLDDIQQKWMEPATSDKISRISSPTGRPLLGSKGIGRFAAAKLGQELEMRTTAVVDTKKGLTQTTRVFGIDWEVFDSTKYLSDVEFPYEVVQGDFEVGTQLTISKLRNKWSKESVSRLHQEMRRLISPLSVSEDSEFRIYLDLSACTVANCGFDGVSIINGSVLFSDSEAQAILDTHRVDAAIVDLRIPSSPSENALPVSGNEALKQIAETIAGPTAVFSGHIDEVADFVKSTPVSIAPVFSLIAAGRRPSSRAVRT